MTDRIYPISTVDELKILDWSHMDLALGDKANENIAKELERAEKEAREKVIRAHRYRSHID